MVGNTRKCEICGMQESRRPGWFASFPSDEVRCKLWVKIVGNEDLIHLPIEKLSSNRHICKDHFAKKHFNKKGNRLKKNAVPTLKLSASPLLDDQLITFPQHVASKTETTPKREKKGRKRKLEENTDITPRKRRLMTQLKNTKCSLSSLKKSSKLIESLDSNFLKNLVLDAIKNQKRKSRGQRWTTKNKISALAIFKRSAKTYRYLSHIMPLPSEKTLQNLMRQIPVKTGLNNAALSFLAKVAKDKTPKENTCCILFDEISIKPCLIYNEGTDVVEGYEDYGNERTEKVANKALVFMVQGLYKKFKQPISFYFVKGTVSKERLSVLIKEMIRAVQKTGFRVMNTVCDQGPTNVGALTLLTEGSGKNYFTIDGNDQKVYILYDIPHLFKSIRNNFLNHGRIVMNGIVGKWAHLHMVEEKNENLLRLSKISKAHIQPKYRGKMRVKYAAQALSMTVSAVLKLLSEAAKEKPLSKELMDTALVVEELDRLFDLTNGPSGQKDIKKGRRQNVSAKTNHSVLWSELKKTVSSIKFLKNDNTEAKNVRCVQGYLTTINSLQDIWKEVQELGFRYLNLRQLNQDALENLFGLIRQHSPTNRNPTCSSFIAAIKSSIVTGLTASHSRNSNCEKDDKSLLTDFHDIIFDKKEKEEDPEDVEKCFVEAQQILAEKLEDTEDFPTISLTEYMDDDFLIKDLSEIEQQPTVYVSGYIASTFKNQKCTNCHDLITTKNYDDDIYAYTRLREWYSNKLSLTYPSTKLCREIESAINIFEKEIIRGKKLQESNIRNLCSRLFLSGCDFTWFTCADHQVEVTITILERLAKLLIRRQCFRINQIFRKQEEELASKIKKAEQSYKD